MGGVLSLADGEIWLPIPILRRLCDTYGHWEGESREIFWNLTPPSGGNKTPPEAKMPHAGQQALGMAASQRTETVTAICEHSPVLRIFSRCWMIMAKDQ